jgi:hypothetical protein
MFGLLHFKSNLILKLAVFVVAIIQANVSIADEIKPNESSLFYCYFRSHNNQEDHRWTERFDSNGEVKKSVQIPARDAKGKSVTIDISVSVKLLGEHHPFSHAEFFDYEATYTVNKAEPLTLTHKIDRFAGYVFSQFSVNADQLDQRFIVLVDRATPEEKKFMSENVTITTFCQRGI